MKLLKKLTGLTAVCLFLTVAPLYAGMEPFFKGEWGMTPQEIHALYNVAAVQSAANADGAQLTYVTEIEGFQAATAYSFDDDNRLYQAYVSFQPQKLSAAQVKALLDKLAAMIVPADENDPFKHETGEFNFPMEGVWNGFHTWQNATDYIGLMATITFADTDRAEISFTFDAYDVKNPINGVYTEEELKVMR